MEYTLKIDDLIELRNQKIKIFEFAFEKYIQEGQVIITFREMCNFKDEIDEIEVLIAAMSKVLEETEKPLRTTREANNKSTFFPITKRKC